MSSNFYFFFYFNTAWLLHLIYFIRIKVYYLERIYDEKTQTTVKEKSYGKRQSKAEKREEEAQKRKEKEKEGLTYEGRK